MERAGALGGKNSAVGEVGRSSSRRGRSAGDVSPGGLGRVDTAERSNVHRARGSPGSGRIQERCKEEGLEESWRRMVRSKGEDREEGSRMAVKCNGTLGAFQIGTEGQSRKLSTLLSLMNRLILLTDLDDSVNISFILYTLVGGPPCPVPAMTITAILG